MGFADWKRRSELVSNVMAYSTPTSSNILRALEAAYKAGERDGRKQVEAILENCVGLAVLAEREVCANVCEAEGIGHRDGFGGHCAAMIRKCSN